MILRILMLISLLACIALIIPWVRSYTVTEAIGHETRLTGGGRWDYTFTGVSTSRGLIASGRMNEINIGPTGEMTTDRRRWIAGRNDALWWEFERGDHHLGFSFDHFQAKPLGLLRKVWLVTVPFWAVTLVLLAWPLSVIATGFARRARHRKRIAQGRCPHCGYDLHGIAAQRCPECGRPE